MTSPHTSPLLDQVADRVEQLLARHHALQQAHDLLQQQVIELGQERDSLKSRLAAARARIDSLLDRIPVDASPMHAPVLPPTAWGTPDSVDAPLPSPTDSAAPSESAKERPDETA